jgi:hypothetical protein
MQWIDQRKVNQAIRDCLQDCDQATDILAGIEAFLLNLQARGGWREAELREVEAGVRRMLYGILDGATYPGDAKNRPSGQSTPDRPSPKSSGA